MGEVEGLEGRAGAAEEPGERGVREVVAGAAEGEVGQEGGARAEEAAPAGADGGGAEAGVEGEEEEDCAEERRGQIRGAVGARGEQQAAGCLQRRGVGTGGAKGGLSATKLRPCLTETRQWRILGAGCAPGRARRRGGGG